MAFPLNLLAPSQFLSLLTPYLSPFHHLSFPVFPSPNFYLYNDHLPLHLSPFLSSSLTLSHHCLYYCIASHIPFPPHSFTFLPLSLHLAHIVFLSHSIYFFLQFSPTHFHLLFFHQHYLSLSGFVLYPSEWRLFFIIFHTPPISPLEAAA